MSSNDRLRGVVVGCRMGRGHARAMTAVEDYELVAVCDLIEKAARAAAEGTAAAVYTDYATMLAETKPDVVAVATPNDLHADFTAQAVEAGARGVYCEKPMATCMAEARGMVDVCREKGVALAVNHQRRTSVPYVTMRRLIEDGAIGDLYLIRGACAGDILSDGTHTVDSLLHLAGDAEVKWVLGQVFRDPPDPAEPKGSGYHASGGWRFGHPIESGGMTTFEFATGVRAEMLTGAARFPNRPYQDIEAFGTKGRLWRSGDAAEPALLICDEQAGGWREAPLDGTPAEQDKSGVMARSFAAFARMIREGAYHPLCAENALRGFEVVMASYESARLRKRIELPLEQDEFPLQLMVDAGEL